ncbi:MAG: WYL domain-containing protein [Bacteroidota bacterium]|nr:WYL domain-containing protein [Bacteroidota bacterium]
MATNKHATIRYLALDKCFRNPGKNFYINDLLKACNEAIQYIDPESDGIKRRQLYEDIKFMESDSGYKIELDKKKDGKEVYYRYIDTKFSIRDKGLNDSEAAQMKEALMILSRFQGMPQFEWVDEVVAKFESSFGLKKGAEKIIGFDENKDYTAVKYISTLFNAILNERVIQVTYKDFKSLNEYDVVIHPYYLKQYNNRWFCFGYDNEIGKIRNLALDRIQKIKEIKLKFLKNKAINFDEYFEDIVGVTVKEEVSIEKILLRISKEHWPYIESKPLHGSQKKKSEENGFVIISIEVRPNYELESLLLSHGDKVEILSPDHFKNKILERVKNIK